MRPIRFQLFIVLIVILLSCGCFSQSQRSSSSVLSPIAGSKTSDLNIGDTAILSSGDYSLAVKVVNFTPLQTDVEENVLSTVRIQYTNVGKKAINGYIVRYLITDWGGVETVSNSAINPRTGKPISSDDQWGWGSLNDCVFFCSDDDYYFYPDEILEKQLQFDLSKKSMDGQLIFTFKFKPENQIKQATWILKQA